MNRKVPDNDYHRIWLSPGLLSSYIIRLTFLAIHVAYKPGFLGFRLTSANNKSQNLAVNHHTIRPSNHRLSLEKKHSTGVGWRNWLFVSNFVWHR